ncbi:MAG: 50S ribosomal protein L23 [bacterium]|jgi:large subunit ribosomal protein L23
MSDFHFADILVKPVITERSMEVAASGKYTFIVARNATKIDIKRAVNERFGVDVVDVNIVNLPGKQKQAGRHRYTEPMRRKAIVTLASGQSIPEIIEAV